MYDQIVTLISNVGFPIAVSIYLLVRVEGKLVSLTESMNKLSRIIETSIEYQKRSKDI